MSASRNHVAEKVDLFVSGHGLANLHHGNVTDAFAVISMHDLKTNALRKLGTTEIIKDDPNPVWITNFTVDYEFEAVQNIFVRVYQEEGGHPTSDENHHTLIGETFFRLSELIGSPGQKLSLDVRHANRGKGQGSFLVRAESRAKTGDLFCVQFAGHKLANKDGFFGRSDPYLVVSRLNEDSTWTVIWKSIRIDNNLSPKWAPVKIPMGLLCNGDIDRPLRIEIFDYDENSSHDTMGVVDTSIRGMISANGTAFPVIELAKKDKKGYTNSGTLTCSNCMIEEHPHCD
jgi:hypothetical protein